MLKPRSLFYHETLLLFVDSVFCSRSFDFYNLRCLSLYLKSFLHNLHNQRERAHTPKLECWCGWTGHEQLVALAI